MYRLNRRTLEVREAIECHQDKPTRIILDLGTADGLMLVRLKETFQNTTFIGTDCCFELLQTIHTDGIHKLQCDAQCLPIESASMDVVIATALIEHLSKANIFMKECARVLRSHGLLVLTTPDPQMDKVATFLGILKDVGHQKSFCLEELLSLCRNNDFNILEAKKFMFSPIGFPAERTFEKLLRALRMDFLMANQLLVARRN